MSCMDTHRCVLNDDSQEIVSEIKESDVLVFATPGAYYEMSGQLKTAQTAKIHYTTPTTSSKKYT